MGSRPCIAHRYAACMAQMVTRVEDDLAAQVDELVAEGVFASRSEAVRLGLERLVDEHRRRRIGEQIVRGYAEFPETDEEIAWADAATRRMVAEEPW
jgi:Arc/MetJ-type ribon-helix-helix transcriptional regulator